MELLRDLLLYLFAILAVAKLTGYFPLSWWWVFAPLLAIPAGLLVAVIYSVVLARYLGRYS